MLFSRTEPIASLRAWLKKKTFEFQIVVKQMRRKCGCQKNVFKFLFKKSVKNNQSFDFWNVLTMQKFLSRGLNAIASF